MIVQIPDNEELYKKIINYLINKDIQVEEVSDGGSTVNIKFN